MKSFLAALSVLMLSTAALAQDTLYKRNKEVLVVKISEIGLDEVKYKLWGYDSGPVIVIAKDQLQKVVFANGLTQYMTQELSNPENYAGQKHNAIKVDFLSPLRDNLSFAYERSIRPGRSIELNIGIIGVGIGTRDWDKASGAFFRVGYKFIKSPDFYMRGMRYSHILKGGYVRPDFIIGSYTINRTIDNSYYNPNPPYNYIPSFRSYSTDMVYGALHISLGKQWIYDDFFLIDIFGGLGYTVTSQSKTDPNYFDYSGVQFGVTGGGDATPLSASGGLRVGFLFK